MDAHEAATRVDLRTKDETKVNVGTTIAVTVLADLDRLAQSQRRSVAAVIRDAIYAYVEAYKVSSTTAA